jgi:hypothetical protein
MSRKGRYVVIVGLTLYAAAVLLSLTVLWTKGPLEGNALPAMFFTAPFGWVGVAPRTTRWCCNS